MSEARSIRLAMAQVNVVVGALEENARTIVEWARRARESGADIVTFPELALTGYPPEDLLLRPGFVEANLRTLDDVAAGIDGIVAVLGFVDRHDDIYNAAAVIHDGRVGGVYHKVYLPNYGVFDEFRYFQIGKRSTIIELGGARVGVSICEDIWYPDGPVVEQAMGAGAHIILNISSSPFHAGKRRWKEQMLRTRAVDNAAIVAYNNLVGGQDELVFDGESMVFGPEGELLARAPQFREDLLLVDLDVESVVRRRMREPRKRQGRPGAEPLIVSVPAPTGRRPALPARSFAEPLSEEGEMYQALVVGTRDYVEKNGFGRAVVALSGGIDSALTGAVAVDAIGKDNVVGVMMPSEFSSKGSIDDSVRLGRNLGIELMTMPITDLMRAFECALAEPFAGRERDVTEENLQARIRGTLIMALSNKFGWLVLSTGNKSEVSVGYCTLYGDMAGGFAVLKDVTKTTVYRLSRYVNVRSGAERIPAEIIDKVPSAELRPDQKDSDSLPPYEELDPILLAYVEEDRGIGEIVEMGFRRETVERVVSLVDRSEYKRRQAAPGIKITPRAFGRDRRMPITNRFRGRSD